ncbi:outer membrane protein assembly factor, partial [Acidobacteriota bacterium]
RYATEGFIQAEVDTILTNYDKLNKVFTVTIAVIEGVRALVGSIELPPEVAETTGPQAPEIKLQTGHPFRIEDYLNDRIVLNSYYRDQGYFESKISGILKPVENTITVIFTANKGPKPRVGKIRKSKLGKTRLSTIERALTLKEGDLIHATDLARSRKRLLEARVFQSVDIQAVPSEDEPQVHDLVVDITEKPEVEINYGLRYSFERDKSKATTTSDNYSSFQIGGSFDILNPFGYGHRYGVSGFFFGKEQFFRAFFETESFFGLHLPTQVYLSDENLYVREISNLKTRIQKITFQQYKKWGELFEANRWGETLRLQWNYSFRHIILTPLDEEFDRLETDRGSISLALIGDTRNSFVNPMRGLFWSVSSEFARTWLGSDVNYIKLFGQLYYYVPIGEDITWAIGLRLGAVPGENPVLIIEDRFRAGGPNTIRAFPLNSLGPKNKLGEPLGGQAVFIFNQELRFPIYKSFHGGIFYDAGNVFALVQEMNFKDIRHSAGLGLRYMLPFGPIRFDWAYILDPKPGETRSRFVFSIGHAF